MLSISTESDKKHIGEERRRLTLRGALFS